jgi:hypothetical protein
MAHDFEFLDLKAAAAAEVTAAVFQRIEMFTTPLAPSGRSDIRRKNSRAAVRRAHSGNPAFRRPSINTFEFEYPPRAINAEIVKAGSS